MLAQAADRIHSFAPYLQGQRVVLACSGGADSTFLALAWRYAAAHLPQGVADALPEATVVIIDHGHRAGSDSDALQAQSLYSSLGLPAEIRTLQASADANESTLRSARYAALLQAATDHNASRILFAHHADDHAETVLLRILRGTGLAGLSGIPARRALSPDVELLRPMLALRSAAIRQTLHDANQPWIEDPSNADPALAARNHLRHQVMPQLDALASAFINQTIYGNAMSRIPAIARLFPNAEIEFHLALRNPATFIPAVFARTENISFDQFMRGTSPYDMRWSSLVHSIRASAPDAKLTVWCNEDTPMIWPRLMHTLTGMRPDTPLDGETDLLAEIMTANGVQRYKTYMQSHPPQTEAQHSRVIAAFLDKFAIDDTLEEDLDAPGWTQQLVDDLTLAYEEDFDQIGGIAGVNVITP
ncbi:MAG: tRNA lysidine(34) synthetase TilS [Planctomycetota bacterium]